MHQTDTLQIVCPRRHRFLPLMLSGASLVLLVPALAHRWARLPDPAACLALLVILGMLLFIAAILYRNLVFRDRLCIVRGEGIPGQRLTCFAHEVVALRRLSRGAPYSAEGKWEALGLDAGLIEIRTTTGCFRFGVGLSEDAADATLERIAAFCGLQMGPDGDDQCRQAA